MYSTIEDRIKHRAGLRRSGPYYNLLPESQILNLTLKTSMLLNQ